MGAYQIHYRKSAKTAAEAFRTLVDNAKREFGTGGYTGTIAEKTEFQMEQPLEGETPLDCVSRCAEDESHWSSDTWGAAACVDGGVDPEHPGLRIFHFVGWASA